MHYFDGRIFTATDSANYTTSWDTQQLAAIGTNGGAGIAIRAGTNTGTVQLRVGYNNGTLFIRNYNDSAYADIALRKLIVELNGTNSIKTYTTTSAGLGVIRTGSNNSTYTPITINTTHGGSYGAYYMVSFYHNNGYVGTILHNGSNTTYASASDYRLKKDIETISDGLDKINNLKPKYYNFIGNQQAGIQAGFIAHELQEIIPQAAFGEKDAVDEDGKPILQQIEKAAIVPHLVSAVQQLSSMVESLQYRIEQLESI